MHFPYSDPRFRQQMEAPIHHNLKMAGKIVIFNGLEPYPSLTLQSLQPGKTYPRLFIGPNKNQKELMKLCKNIKAASVGCSSLL